MSSLSSLLMRLIEQGQSESPRVIQLPKEARQILEEAEGKEPDPTVARRLTVTACEVALVFYRCALAREPELNCVSTSPCARFPPELLRRTPEGGRLVP